MAGPLLVVAHGVLLSYDFKGRPLWHPPVLPACHIGVIGVLEVATNSLVVVCLHCNLTAATAAALQIIGPLVKDASDDTKARELAA